VVVERASGGSGDPIRWETSLTVGEETYHFPWGLYCEDTTQTGIEWYRPLDHEDEGRIGVVRYNDTRPAIPVVGFTVGVLTVKEKRAALSEFQTKLREAHAFSINFPREWESEDGFLSTTVWVQGEATEGRFFIHNGVARYPTSEHGHVTAFQIPPKWDILFYTVEEWPAGTLVCVSKGCGERGCGVSVLRSDVALATDYFVEDHFECLREFYGDPPWALPEDLPLLPPTHVLEEVGR